MKKLIREALDDVKLKQLEAALRKLYVDKFVSAPKQGKVIGMRIADVCVYQTFYGPFVQFLTVPDESGLSSAYEQEYKIKNTLIKVAGVFNVDFQYATRREFIDRHMKLRQEFLEKFYDNVIHMDSGGYFIIKDVSFTRVTGTVRVSLIDEKGGHPLTTREKVRDYVKKITSGGTISFETQWT